MAGTFEKLRQIQARAAAPGNKTIVKAVLEEPVSKVPQIYPEEREVWGKAYRIFERYTQQVRAAAALDDENDKAEEVFKAAAAELSELYNYSKAGKRLSIMVYELLEDAFNIEIKAKL